MLFKRSNLIFYWCFCCFLTACFSSEQIEFAPDEKIYCDLTLQYLEGETKIKSEVQFSIQGNDSTRPYFLTDPVLINSTKLEKKFVPKKGVYYWGTQSEIQLNQPIFFTFNNVDGKKHEIQIEFQKNKQFRSLNTTLSLKNKSKWLEDEKNQVSWMILDSKKEVHIINPKNNMNEMNKGMASIVQILEKDSIIPLEKHLVVRTKIKSLSLPQKVEIID